LSGDPSDDGYLLDNAQAEAGARFDALSTLFDPSTFRHVEALGIEPGWRCWEVGAGGRSVPDWLASRVGTGGHVLATDLDVSWLPGEAGYEVRRHDIGTDPVPEEKFDLVHARLVLVHVPQREQALRTLVRALKPGGWLLLEDADPALQPLLCPDESGPEQVLANRLRRGFRSLMAERGVDLAYGRNAPAAAARCGTGRRRGRRVLPDHRAGLHSAGAGNGGAGADRLVAGGLATEAEIDEHVTNVRTGRLDLATSPMVSAWGRR
jgi:hypothetical protein